MKKLLIIVTIILSLFLSVGCTEKKEKQSIEKEKSTYIKNVQKLKKIKKSTDNLPFNVEVKYEKMKNEIRYQVIIDNPKEDIKNISALAIHNKQTDDVFPSIGIFDKKLNLLKDKKPSGVILVGYFPYKGSMDDLKVQMKVLIEYKIDKEKYTSYYVTKK